MITDVNVYFVNCYMTSIIRPMSLVTVFYVTNPTKETLCDHMKMWCHDLIRAMNEGHICPVIWSMKMCQQQAVMPSAYFYKLIKHGAYWAELN